MEEQEIPEPTETRGLLLGQNFNAESVAEKISQILIVFLKPFTLFSYINKKYVCIYFPPFFLQ